jgi:hypothetical protein
VQKIFILIPQSIVLRGKLSSAARENMDCFAFAKATADKSLRSQ